MQRVYKVNAYIKSDDKFPVNTWVGDYIDVLEWSSDLMKNEQNGIARFEIIIDESHPGWIVGQNPRDL